MNPEFRKVLKRQIELRGHTMSSISTELGHSRAWLQRLLAKTRLIREDHLNEVLQKLDMTLEELFAEYLQAVASPEPIIKLDFLQSPALLLRALRGKNDPDLGWLAAFEAISAAPVPRDARFPLHPKVRRIDDMREFDRQAALVESESWLGSLMKRAEDRRLNSEETSHLCSALGVWSSIQRALGKQALGAKALELAWYLHGKSPSAPSCGDLLERTARASYEYGYPLAGFPLMQQAFAIAATTDDPDREVRSLLGLGSLAYRTGQLELARSLFQKIVEHPARDQHRMAAASSFLASDYEERGLLEQALEQLFSLKPILPDLPVGYRLSLLGRQAHILTRLGELENAKALYEQILQGCRPHFSPIDRGMVLLYLVEVLIKLERQDLICHHTRNIPDLLAELEDTPLARQVLNGLMVAVRRGDELHTEQIAGMRRRLKESSGAEQQSG